jgi:hypothetical protein
MKGIELEFCIIQSVKQYGEKKIGCVAQVYKCM